MKGGTQGSRPTRGEPLSTDDRELIDRYVAGRLSESELDEVEARIVADGAFRAEVELTESLRAGLRALEAQGELASAERLGPALWRRPSYALAASVVAGALGIVALALYGQLEHTRAALAGLEGERARSRPGAVASTRIVAVERTRAASGADVVLSAADPAALLELRVDPGPAPVDRYAVTLARVDGAVVATLVRVPRAMVSEDGVVVLKVHSALLSPGEYRVALTPLDGAAVATEYRIRVER